MRIRGTELQLSATDLANFLGCRHRTALDMATALGKRVRPRQETDPLLEILWQRGLDHEKRYVDSLRAAGRTISDLSQIASLKDVSALVEATSDAMRRGADVIVQGGLRDGRWFGKPDVLRRIERPSAFGDWSYEVIDTKLSKETKAGTILQLGLYSEMLSEIQETRPEHFYVVTPDKVTPQHQYRLDDFAAYFRLVRRQMLETLDRDPDETAAAYYPEPVPHCDICHWDRTCDAKRRKDDHLSLVAFMSRVQRRELESRKITTLTQLALLPLPIAFKPKRGSAETYARVREQARLQLASRSSPKPPAFELRKIVENKNEGLCRLPKPSPGDVFLDLEGDPFAGESGSGGREYLFGVVTLERDGTPKYTSFWGFTEHDERVAFENVMDLISGAWQKHPEMHVYHYAPYEPSALKRLMGRYATRGREMDALLSNEKFVDLYALVRQGVVVGSERYSIKNLEPLYAFEREVRLLEANRCLRVVEQALELNVPETIPADVKAAVQGYNKDDCVSTLRLRDWLEEVRSDAVAKEWDIPRPTPPVVEAEELTEHELRVAQLRKKLLKGVPETHVERSDEQQARWLLAFLLDYHSREAKATWWEYYRLKDLPEEDLFDEPQAIAGLEFVERVHVKLSKKGKPTGTVVDRYRFPVQEMEVERGDLHLREGGKFGSVVDVDRDKRTIDVQKGPGQAEKHPNSVFAYTYIASRAQEDALFAIGSRVAAEGGVKLGKSNADRVGRALLLAQPPRLASGEFAPKQGEDTLDFLKRAVISLDHSVLPVQGPPGAGKTFSGAEMICALVERKKKVGIAATSHKVIRNLLDAVAEAAKGHNQAIKLAHKVDDDGAPAIGSGIAQLESNDAVAAALESGDAQVVGGTSWVWAHEKLADSVDVLFVDEAGQVSLANVLAMSPSAKSIVLLGDPQQLEQPNKASHPHGVDVSALEHLLGGHKTVPPDRGVFLPVTWRLSPALTAFTSEMFYENRLTSKPGLEEQRLNGAAEFEGSGLWVVPVEHDGNRTSSIEEIEQVAELVDHLTAKGVTWTNEQGKQSQVVGKDILIVAPYNAQVSRLSDRLASTGARVGTVDKFQGQEAPVVIYSMATSRPEDAPRGMEFLYSINRLNVATSRARCAAIVVANDRLFEPECRTARQMKLANALCRYAEIARHQKIETVE